MQHYIIIIIIIIIIIKVRIDSKPRPASCPAWPGSETDHSPPSSAEVKNTWSYTYIPQYACMAWCLIKHRDKHIIIIYTLLRRSQDSSVV
jgi:hypothetical protein